MNRRTVFVSYSRKDSSQVEKAVELLEAGGADVFRDLDDIQYGDRWEDVIRTKLAEAERVLVFWSTHAQLSEWVSREWTIAISMQKRVVPILLDQTPLPRELGQFHALTNFILPNTEIKAQAVSNPVKPKTYWLWGGLIGLVILVAVVSFSSFRLQPVSIPPEVVAVKPNDTELHPPNHLGQEQGANNLPSDSSTEPITSGSGYPSTATPMAKPQLPLAPEPEFKDETRNYLAVLSVFLVLFVLIGYLIWKRRQQQNKLQAGEKFVQEIFQE